MENATQKTHDMAQRWVTAKQRVKRSRAELNGAECELINASNELGKWLVPESQPEGELFNIWFGSGVIQALKLKGRNDYDVLWRKEPDGKDRQVWGA